jgi:hypothetical protein
MMGGGGGEWNWNVVLIWGEAVGLGCGRGGRKCYKMWLCVGEAVQSLEVGDDARWMFVA